MLTLRKKSYHKPRQCIKEQRHHFADKSPSSQSCEFFSGHVWIWELDHNEDWALKNWCFWTVMLEKMLKRPLDSKEIKLANSKENQPWIFNGITDAEAEAPFGHLMWRTDSLEKTLMLGKVESLRRRGWQDEMFGWHHWLNGHEFEQTQGDSEGQGSLLCCSPWGCKELNMA